MSFLGECHAVRVVVQPGVGGRAQRPYQIRGSTAVSGADLQHLFAAEIRLGRRAVVKLDAVPVGLILRGQRQSQRRIFLIAPVEKGDVFVFPPAADQGVPVLVHGYFQPRERVDGLDVPTESASHSGEYARRIMRCRGRPTMQSLDPWTPKRSAGKPPRVHRVLTGPLRCSAVAASMSAITANLFRGRFVSPRTISLVNSPPIRRRTRRIGRCSTTAG